MAWIGYKTPAIPSLFGDFGVFDVNYAVGGGTKLAAGMGGLAAVRRDSKPDLNIVAHFLWHDHRRGCAHKPGRAH